jgi:hypothetical protein
MNQNIQLCHARFCPAFSECRLFSAGMKIVVNKNLENAISAMFLKAF